MGLVYGNMGDADSRPEDVLDENYFPPWNYSLVDKSKLSFYKIQQSNSTLGKVPLKIDVQKIDKDNEFMISYFKNCPAHIKQTQLNERYLTRFLQQF